MIVLMSGHSLTAAERFSAERLELQLSERGSTATLTLGPDAPVISVDNWLTVEDGPGAGIVWRVKTIDTQFDRKTRTVTMEHVINTLRDMLMFGEIKSSDISGSSANPTAKQTVEYILNRQSDWVLGDFYYTSVSNPYSFNGDDLFSALETVSGSLEDCIWEYSFASYPFTLHIRHMDSTVCSEMRTDRNIRTLKKTIDRSRMYTRMYPIGKNNLHIDGNYVSKNENLYGTVCKTETDQSQDTKAKLQAWAQERLDRHCEPSVTVTISGFELADATGESLDSFIIGKMCNVPLPEFSTIITERVTKLSYPDAINTPEDVTVTLANELMDVATIIKQQNSSGGRGGRTAAKDAEEDHAWIVDTADKVELVAEAVAGKDGGHADWSRVAALTVDGNGIDARVVVAEGELVSQASRLTIDESSISTLVTKTGINSLGANETLYSNITQNASRIALVVTQKNGTDVVNTANIVLGINSQDKTSSSYVDISANYINLTGYVTATDLQATNATISNLTSGASTAASLKSHLLAADTGFTYQNDSVSWKSKEVRYCTLSSEYYFLIASSSGSTTPFATKQGRVVTAYSNDTIYYLGKNASS